MLNQSDALKELHLAQLKLKYLTQNASEKPPISRRNVSPPKKRECSSPIKSPSKRNDISGSSSNVVSLSTAYLMQHKNMQNKVAKHIVDSANGSASHSVAGTEDTHSVKP